MYGTQCIDNGTLQISCDFDEILVLSNKVFGDINMLIFEEDRKYAWSRLNC